MVNNNINARTRDLNWNGSSPFSYWPLTNSEIKIVKIKLRFYMSFSTATDFYAVMLHHLNEEPSNIKILNLFYFKKKLVFSSSACFCLYINGCNWVCTVTPRMNLLSYTVSRLTTENARPNLEKNWRGVYVIAHIKHAYRGNWIHNRLMRHFDGVIIVT